ncbi:hypothetical protein [Priestia megaterium]|uniref:Uncharacterized protein n=1 Tax=Priestia megaterium TaxID=1404 RepID=A0A6M6E1N9_PRIMG|nr:hypothetical protein [Priestia megaterium]QJX80993.1 hypothetical protein FDZ14_33425 [Priestia megaterium]
MIFEETYHFLLHNVSSKEFDVCLVSLLNVDWDGVIQISPTQTSNRVGTKRKYMKEMIKRLSSSKRQNVFIPDETEEGTKYRFTLGPTRNLGFNKHTDKYCKKYSFFYTEAFRSLPLNAKRLLLMAAFRMSTLKSEKVMFKYHEIVPNSKNQGNRFFTKSRLEDAIHAIENSELNNVVSIELENNPYSYTENHTDAIVFSFAKGTLNDFLENQTERDLLRKHIYQAGFPEYINDELCKEIEGVGMSLYKSLLKIEKQKSMKQGVISGAKDELLKLARFIYNAAIKKLSLAFHSKPELLANPKQASAYFSTLICDEATQEMKNYANQRESIKSLLNNEFLHKEISTQALGEEVGFIEVYEHIQPIREKYNKAAHISNVLSIWYEKWVISRYDALSKDVEVLQTASSEEVEKVKKKRNWTSLECALNSLRELKARTYEQLDKLTEQVKSYGNKALFTNGSIALFEAEKQSLKDYFTFQQENRKNLTNVSA